VRHGLIDVYRKAAVIVLNVLVLVALLEAVAATVLGFMPAVPFPAETSPYFARLAWAPEYWREFYAVLSRFHYHPFFLWRAAPVQGRYIRVSAEGLRVTPGAECNGQGAMRIWVFGGSTVWGMASRDEHTIPAHLQAILARTSSPPICVVNFGQPGFVSTQSVIQLENEIRRGRHPGVAIFYEGANDIMSGFAYLRADAHFAFPEIRRRVEAQRLDAKRPSLIDMLAWSSQYRLAVRLLAKPAVAGLAGPRPDSLANDVVATYLANVKIVQSLARTYGFRAVFFWQPTLVTGTKKTLTDAERSITDGRLYVPFAQRVHSRFLGETDGIADVYDLTHVLDHETTTSYVDWHHTTPEANGTIAQAVAKAMGPAR
jgi:hypothetical protein